ncbi:hypothetical protein ACFL2U_00780 [Patescibacteria group bacterium]
MDQATLDKMEPEELLKTYFDNYGKVSKDGFLVPSPISRETSAGCFAFRALQDSKEGVKLLEKTIRMVKKGEIDQYGKPCKGRKIIKKKKNTKKKS